MRQRTYCQHIKAAGFVLKLIFHSPDLPRHKLPFPNPRSPGTIAAVIDIYPPKTAKSIRHIFRGNPAVTGEGEYDGAFYPRSRRGYVVINDRNAGTILVNFLTQVFSHLVFAGNGLMIHSACVIRQNQAYIFCGPSGAGKSTACSFSPDCRIASDDLTAVRKTGRRFRAWGIPQLERFPIPAKQGPFRIKGLFRLVKDRKTGLVPMSAAKAVAGALAIRQNQLSTPRKIAKTLQLLDELTDHVPGYELHFRKDPSFWKCLK